MPVCPIQTVGKGICEHFLLQPSRCCHSKHIRTTYRLCLPGNIHGLCIHENREYLECSYHSLPTKQSYYDPFGRRFCSKPVALGILVFNDRSLLCVLTFFIHQNLPTERLSNPLSPPGIKSPQDPKETGRLA